MLASFFVLCFVVFADGYPGISSDDRPKFGNIGFHIVGCGEKNGKMLLRVRISNDGNEPVVVRRDNGFMDWLEIRDARGKTVEGKTIAEEFTTTDEYPKCFLMLRPEEVFETTWWLYIDLPVDKATGRVNGIVEEGMFFPLAQNETYTLRIRRKANDSGYLDTQPEKEPRGGDEDRYVDIEKYFGGKRFTGVVYSNWVRLELRNNRLFVTPVTEKVK